MRGSERDVLLVPASQWRTKGSRSSSSFHRQHDDEKGLIEVAVVKLRSLTEAVGHQIIGDFESFQYGEWTLHGGLLGLAMDPIGDRRNQLQGGLHVFRFYGVGFGVSRREPGRASQQVEQAGHALAGGDQEIHGCRLEDRSLQPDLSEPVHEVGFDLSRIQDAQGELRGDP